MRERQIRTEARVGDLTKELLTRSIDLSNIRERLAQMEAHLIDLQRTAGLTLGEAAVGGG
jgi:hypothetical protein